MSIIKKTEAMGLSNRQREYIADSLGKISEYLVSIVILGQFVAGRGVDSGLTLIAGFLFVASMMMGTFILGKVEEKSEA